MTTLAKSLKYEIKENLSISVPLIAAQLIYALSSFLGTAFVAQLGEDALAASILVSIVWASLSMLFFGILNSVSVLVSHQYGAKNYSAISQIMGQSFWLGAIMTVLLTFVLLSLPIFMHWSSQPPTVLALANTYIFSLIWTIPGLVILVIIEQFLAGINRAKLVLRISMLIVPIEIPLIYALVFGKFGFPNCGVAGIGYGFAITYTLTTVLLVWYLLVSAKYRPFKIFGALNEWNMHYMKELMRVGTPMGFMHVIEISAFAVATFWIAQFGTTLLAAHQIVIQYLSFVITMVFAMSQAVTIRVGHAVGLQDEHSVRYSYHAGVLISTVCILFVTVGFVLIPEMFVRLDIHNLAEKKLIHEASALLSICGILLIFDNFRIVGFGALRGLKDTRFSMFASLFSFWFVALGVSYLLGFHFRLGGCGIWYGLVVGIASGALIVFLRMRDILKRLDLKKVMEIP